MKFKLFPKLQLGNPVQEALASCLFGSDWYPHAWKQLLGLIWSLSTFYRDDSLGKLELPRLVSQAGAWETAEVLIRKYCFARSDPRFVLPSHPGWGGPTPTEMFEAFNNTQNVSKGLQTPLRFRSPPQKQRMTRSIQLSDVFTTL